jgi:hypothetical protein
MSYRILLALLTGLSFLGGAAHSQSIGVARANDFNQGNQSSPIAQIKITGGLLIDYVNNEFGYQDPTTIGSYTNYGSFSAMFTALSGVVTSSEKWIYDATGTLVQTSANTVAEPCYGGDGELRGICWENAATNDLLQSATFTSATWTKTNVTATAAARTAPTGTLVASTLTENGAAGNHQIIQNITKAASALTYTASCWFAPGAGDRVPYVYVDDNAGNGAYAIFNFDYTSDLLPTPVGVGTSFTTLAAHLQAGGLVAADRTSPYGYVRVGLTFTTNTATTLRVAFGLSDGTNLSYTGDNTSSLAIWGCQAQQNTVGSVQTSTVMSSYIPTTTVTAARVIDQIKMSIPTNLQSRSAYSFLLDVRLPDAAQNVNNVFMAMENAANTKRITLVQNNVNVANTFSMQLVDSSTASVTTGGPLSTFNQGFGIAAVAKPGANWIRNTGQSTKTSTSATFPSDPLTILQLASYSTGATLTSNSALTQLAIFADALSTQIMTNLLFPLPPYNPDANFPPNYFTQAMLSSVYPGWEVWRSARLPTSDAESNATYPWYPVTAVYGQSVLSHHASTSTTVAAAALAWGNRCNLCRAAFTGTGSGTALTVTGVTGTIVAGYAVFGTGVAMGTTIVSQTSGTPGGAGVYVTSQATTSSGASLTAGGIANMKPNSAAGTVFFTSNGNQARVNFTTYDKADAAMYAQLLYLNGYPAHASGACPAGSTVGTFTGTGSGTNLTVTALNAGGFLWPGYIVAGTGVPVGTVIVSQTSGTPGGAGVYVTDNATTSSGDALTVTSIIRYCGYLDVTAAYGIPDANVVSYTTAKANPDFYFPNTTTQAGVSYSTVDDWVFLHDATLAGGTNQIWGVLCDCEMSDGRLASRNTANMIEFSNITRAAGYRYAVVSNGLLGAGQNGGFCGIGATTNNCDMGANGNLNPIVTNVDQFFISAGSPAPTGYTFATSLTKYWSMIGAPGSFPQGHVILQFVLGAWPAGTTVRNASEARAFAIANNVGGVVIAPVFAQMGGSATRCTNQKIQVLLFGTFTSPMDPGCQP